MSLINVLVVAFCLTPLLAWSMVTLYFEYIDHDDESNEENNEEQSNL